MRDKVNTNRLPYPPELAQLLEFPSGRWLDQAVEEARRNGETISDKEQELSYGCNRHVRNILS